MLQTAAVETSLQEPTGAMRRSALAEKLRGLKERSATASAAAKTNKAETARRAQFDRDWENFG
jgi:hypothetical protein